MQIQRGPKGGRFWAPTWEKSLICPCNIGSIYKIEPLLQLITKVLFAPTSYTKIFDRDKHLIQFLLSLYPILLFPRISLKDLKKNSIFIWFGRKVAVCTLEGRP